MTAVCHREIIMQGGKADAAPAADSAAGASHEKHVGEYKKELGLWHVVFLAVGAILGPAIAFTPVSVLAFAGPAGIASWIISLLLIFPLAMVYAELGTMWPKSGGVAYYPLRSNGALVGLFNGWGAFVGYVIAPASIIIAFVQYVSYFWPALFQKGTLSALGIALSIGIMFTVFLINILRIRRIGDINNILTILTIALIAVIVVVLLFYFAPSNVTGATPGGYFYMGSAGLFVAVSATIYGYGGFRQPVDYAEEIHDPGKNVPKAIAATLLITATVYLMESLAFAGAINWSAVGAAPGDWGALLSLPYPFVTVSNGVGLASLAIVSIVVALIASYKDGIIYFGAAARVGNTMSRYDYFFPQKLGDLNKKGVPFVAAILALVVTVFFILLLPAFSEIFSVVVDGLLVSYAPGAISLAVFRKRYPNEHRPYKLPLYQIFAPFSFIVASLLILFSGWFATSILIVTVLLGVFFLAVYHKRKGIHKQDLVLGIWYPVYLFTILGISYFSSYGGTGLIPFPYDTLTYIVAMAVFYIWGYYTGVAYKERADFTSQT